MAEVRLERVKKNYDHVEVVKGIDLEIADQSFVALVGPSGCGKSTTLRMIAGLEGISGGRVSIGGRVVNDVLPKDRDIAMVFQSYALYPHMTACENMSFGLRLRGMSRQEIKRRVGEAADILHLDGLLDRLPRQLSGGQRQRVAMGRAIVRNPKVFLFDEPLSNLDAKLRVKMRTELKLLHQRLRTTTVYVTHDQIEAMTLADKIVVMNGGRIEQCGTPAELYASPRTRFVAGFMGSPAMNMIECRVQAQGTGVAVVLPTGATLSVPLARTSRYRPAIGKSMLLGLRPEHLTDCKGSPEPDDVDFEAPVNVSEPTGPTTLVFFRLGATEACAMVDPGTEAAAGRPMMVRARMAHMHLIDPETDLVL